MDAPILFHVRTLIALLLGVFTYIASAEPTSASRRLQPQSVSWPTEGTVVYYAAPIVSEQCLIPLALFRDHEDKEIGTRCEHFSNSEVFKFQEAVGGTRVQLTFSGSNVTGNWVTNNRSSGNTSYSHVNIGGQTFVLRPHLGGKIGQGEITGRIMSGVIHAYTSGDGWCPPSKFRIIIRKTVQGISWQSYPRQSGSFAAYLPEKEELYPSAESVEEFGW